MKQLCITTAMGKRLIGKGMAQHPRVREVLERGTLAIIAGTTNGYVAEEILTALGQAEGFTRVGFRRGFTVAPGRKAADAQLAGDVIIVKGSGCGVKRSTMSSMISEEGDLVLKGANAFDPFGQAAVQIGHPQGGTIHTVLSAVYGRRVEIMIPVGVEKRVFRGRDRSGSLRERTRGHRDPALSLPRRYLHRDGRHRATDRR
jgi:hypothetical protein